MIPAGQGSEPDPLSDQPSDHTLLRRLRSGEQDAATALYLRYAQRLIGLAERQTPRELSSRVDAEDVVQSVFRTFFRRVSKGSYEVARGEDLWKLLLVISLNKIRTTCIYHRATKRSVSNTSSLVAMRDGDELTSQFPCSSDELPTRLLEMTIRELLAGQPAICEQIITLRIQGHEVAEIAQRLGRSKRTVERVLQGFRGKLAKQLEE